MELTIITSLLSPLTYSWKLPRNILKLLSYLIQYHSIICTQYPHFPLSSSLTHLLSAQPRCPSELHPWIHLRAKGKWNTCTLLQSLPQPYTHSFVHLGYFPVLPMPTLAPRYFFFFRLDLIAVGFIMSFSQVRKCCANLFVSHLTTYKRFEFPSYCYINLINYFADPHAYCSNHLLCSEFFFMYSPFFVWYLFHTQ